MSWLSEEDKEALGPPLLIMFAIMGLPLIATGLVGIVLFYTSDTYVCRSQKELTPYCQVYIEKMKKEKIDTRRL
jgi:hypothetical protein